MLPSRLGTLIKVLVLVVHAGVLCTQVLSTYASSFAIVLLLRYLKVGTVAEAEQKLATINEANEGHADQAPP
jgi:hypothetical protein